MTEPREPQYANSLDQVLGSLVNDSSATWWYDHELYLDCAPFIKQANLSIPQATQEMGQGAVTQYLVRYMAKKAGVLNFAALYTMEDRDPLMDEWADEDIREGLRKPLSTLIADLQQSVELTDIALSGIKKLMRGFFSNERSNLSKYQSFEQRLFEVVQPTPGTPERG